MPLRGSFAAMPLRGYDAALPLHMFAYVATAMPLRAARVAFVSFSIARRRG